MEISISPLRTFPNGKGFGFNVALGFEDDDSGWGVQVNGFRIFPTGFYSPGIAFGKGRYYSATLFPKELALKIVKVVLEANPELEAYLNPGLTLEVAMQGLVGDNASLSKFSIPLTIQEKE
jgi:hypothetical protein